MDYSGEAAEQIIRVSLDGAITTLKLSGTASKHLAVLLVSILNEQNRSKGKVKLATMLKSEKTLSVYSVPKDRLAEFAKEAKHYGIVYCALRDKSDNKDFPVEVLVKEDDATRVERIFERLQFGSVDVSSITKEIEKSLNEKSQEKESEKAEKNEQFEYTEEQTSFQKATEKSQPSVRSEKESEGRKLKETEKTAISKKSVRKKIDSKRKERKENEYVPMKRDKSREAR